MRRGSPWLLPFLITGGMALGAFAGASLVLRATGKPDATLDWDAALLGAPLLVAVPGLAWSLFVMFVARMSRRAAQDRFALRLVLSIAGGAAVSALAESGANGELASGLLFLVSTAALGWSWAGPTTAGPGPGPRGGWRAAWILPFLVSGGTAFGAMMGFSLAAGDVMLQEGPTGDLMGAAGALLVLLSLGGTFAASTLTVVLANLLHCDPPGGIGLRTVFSLGSGGVIGALSPDQRDGAQLLTVLLLPAAAVVLSWPWRLKRTLPAAADAPSHHDDHAGQG